MVTDGDLRRAFEQGLDLRYIKAGELGSNRPKSIGPDALATSALELMERFSITSLVVLDEEARLVGVVHLHDLLRHGLA